MGYNDSHLKDYYINQLLDEILLKIENNKIESNVDLNKIILIYKLISKNKKITLQKQLKNITDTLIEDIINTPGDEILKEVKEDYGDANYELNKFNKILEKAKNEVKNNN